MSTMGLRTEKTSDQRRSQRVILSMSVVIDSAGFGGSKVREETFTLVVNAHGALVLLSSKVIAGQLLTIKNVKTQEELYCLVVTVRPNSSCKAEVGIEFIEPSPRFWRISFPPEDWTPRSPEAKRYPCTAQVQQKVASA